MYVGSFSPELVETSDRKWTRNLLSFTATNIRAVYTGDPVVTESGTLEAGMEGDVHDYETRYNTVWIEWDAGFATTVKMMDVETI